MKIQTIFKTLAGFALTAPTIYAKSQDYARHLELSLLFYEAQRSGVLPENNRIYWRRDSMVDAGADNKVDLTGGYYDAGDNVKFNFPQASSLTLLAWAAYEWKDGYVEAEQWEYIKDTIKWGTDYFIKCHTSKNTLWGQVGNGSLDHGAWVAPEDINYDYPSYKIDASAPGSDLAAETAASLAAAYMVFKDEDPSYASTLLKHAKELYDFADQYRDTYTKGIEDAQGYYRSYSGYTDELVWGGAWLYLATGDESYRTKVDAIWDYPYTQYDPEYFLNSGGPISWDDKKASSYALMYEITGDDKYGAQALKHSDLMVGYKTTPGGLWYDTNLSAWGSNRYAANAAFTVAMVANKLEKSDSRRSKYVKFIQKQVDYIQGDNPAKVDYIVGADKSSPKSVHHRGSSGTTNAMGEPAFNVFPLYGALAGGPDASDGYVDDRTNYNSNEVALDYNAGYTGLLAFLIKEGLNVPDPEQTWDGAWPPKEKYGNIQLKLNFNGLNEFAPAVSTTDGLTCGSWCVEIDLSKSQVTLDNVWGGDVLKTGNPFVACSGWGKGFLDGKGTEQNFYFRIKPSGAEVIQPKEAFVYCNGYNRGDKYLVKTDGSGSEPYGWERGICKPSYICDANGNYIKDSGVIGKGSSSAVTTTKKATTTTKKANTTTKKVTTTKKTEPTNTDVCFATELGYNCCKTCTLEYSDENGAWGIEDGQWCGLLDSCHAMPPVEPKLCFSLPDYPCCEGNEVVMTDNDGKWGFEDGNWCGMPKEDVQQKECFSLPDYPCCEGNEVVMTDNDGKWGIENDNWCGMP